MKQKPSLNLGYQYIKHYFKYCPICGRKFKKKKKKIRKIRIDSLNDLSQILTIICGGNRSRNKKRSHWVWHSFNTKNFCKNQEYVQTYYTKYDSNGEFEYCIYIERLGYNYLTKDNYPKNVIHINFITSDSHSFKGGYFE